MPPIHEFDQFYVISDLHMGGLPGFQIFQQGSTLASLVDWLTKLDSTQRVGLCINGDAVDFLAEPNARYFDPDGATSKLDRIFADRAFQPVWLALRKLVGTPNRRLIFTLGNHDLELALPWVREHLLRFLTQENDEAAGRVTFSFDGTGYRCAVNGRSVLCIHGNEFDPWNLTDYEHLRRLGRDVMQGRAIAEWTPNAGSKLVIDVMNELKRQYAFVDVLKPEVEAVLPILWVLGETTRPRISGVISVAQRLTWDVVRKATGFLSSGETPTNDSLELVASSDNTLYRPAFDTEQIETDEMLNWAERQVEEGADPLSLVEGGTDRLGMPGAFWGRVRRRPPYEQAWEVLRNLAGDQTFEILREDETYERADQFVGQDVEYLVTGHTHLARDLARRNGSGHYYNSGTWATLLHLKAENLGNADLFRPVFERLKTASGLGSIADLVQQRPTVISIVKGADASTVGKLSVVAVEKKKAVLRELGG